MRESEQVSVQIDDPIVAISINRTYRHGMSAGELYECTRGIWRLKKDRAAHAHYALAVYQGEIKEAYEIDEWFPAGATDYRWRKFEAAHLKERSEFVGKVAPNKIRERYVGHSMPVRFYGNPIRYFNC